MRGGVSVKAWLRDRAGELLLGMGLTDPRRQTPGQLTIATFHRVLPASLRNEYPLPGLVVTPQELECFLDYFGRHFEVAPLGEAARAWSEGAGGARPRLALTFDDAQRDNAEYALPVLDAAGVRATFFAPAGAIESGELLWHDRLAYAAAEGWRVRRAELAELCRAWDVALPADASPARAAQSLVRASKHVGPAERGVWIEQLTAGRAGRAPAWEGMMTWDQLRAAADRGHEIGSHSFSHALLPQCSDDELAHEVNASRQLLEERIGGRVDSFCYPNGDCDTRTVEAVRGAGYRWGVTTAWGANAPGAPALELARHEMHAEHVRARDGAFSEPRLAWRMSRYHPGVRA